MREVDDNNSDATFSNPNPTTSEADILGGTDSRVIWGTNVSVVDTISTFKRFLTNFTKKYRMKLDGKSEEELSHEEHVDDKEYMDMLHEMLVLGTTGLNLDIQNLKAYPATEKLWVQVQQYPQEIIPLMDQSVKDIMVDIAEEEMKNQRLSQSQNTNGNSGHPSSSMPVLSSDRGLTETPAPTPQVADLALEVGTKVYKVRPYGIDKTINLRDLDPQDMDKMISIKGLVIRTTPIIPDMKDAFFRCQVCNHTVKVDIDRGKIAEPTKCPRPVCKSSNSMQIVHNRSAFADKQVIKLQETPDSVPAGQTPHSVSLCAYDELVDMCKAGDRVEITGIFRCSPVRVNPKQRALKNVYKTYVDVLHIQKVDKKRMGIDVSTVEGAEADVAARDIEETRKITEIGRAHV